VWWAWCGGGHAYKTRIPHKKIGPFRARPEPQCRGQTTIRTPQGWGEHLFTLYAGDGTPLFVHHELSWCPSSGHRTRIKRAHIAYDIFGDPLPEPSLAESFVWTNDRWEACRQPLLSDAVPQP
jgi:hypothetical protein